MNPFWFDIPVHRDVTEEVKIWLAGIAAVLVLLHYVWHRWLEPREDKVAKRSKAGLRVMCWALAVMCLMNYSRYDSLYVWVQRLDTYDLSHYYLNAKYFDELGYFELYPAIVLADIEDGDPRFDKQPSQILFQNEEDYYFVRYMDYKRDTARHEQVRALFGPERWAEFKHDFLYLQREQIGFTQTTWSQMLNDHGFNGAPAWVLYAQPLAELVPVEAVKLLTWADTLTLVVALGFVWWAFGETGALFLFIFLTTTYSTRWPTFTWAFGRYEWVSLLIIGVCLLKKQKHALAGVVTALSASFRVFPAVWLFGPAFKGAWRLIVNRRLDRKLLTLGAAFVLMHMALWGAVSLRYSPQTIQSHFHNMFAHTTPENLSSMRQGFALATAYKGETDIKRMDSRRRKLVADQAPWRDPLAYALVLLLGLGLRRAKDHEAFAMGFIPFFLVATASYYYYVIRATLVVMHGGDLRRFRNAVGLALLFVIEAVVNGLQTVVKDYRVIHIGWMAWLLTAYALLMIAWMNAEAFQSWRKERALGVIDE